MSQPPSAACDCAAALTLLATETLDILPPPWLAEVLLVAELWRTSGLVARLQQQLKLERGCMGSYLVLDLELIRKDVKEDVESQRA
jgi:hypothetical protein